MPDTRVIAGDHETTFERKSVDRPVCDFCSTVPGLHVYAARNVVVDTDGPLGASVSTGGWGACDKCKTLIDTNDRAALLARSIKILGAKHPTLPANVLKQMVARPHRAFWKAKK